MHLNWWCIRVCFIQYKLTCTSTYCIQYPDKIILVTPQFELNFVIDLRNLRLLGAVYFLYLFLFSGLEYSLSFLVHQRHHYTRSANVLKLLYLCLDLSIVLQYAARENVFLYWCSYGIIARLGQQLTWSHGF